MAALASGELLSRLIGFAATVYIARQLGVEAYGIIGVGLAILLYASTIVDAGLEHTGPRETAEHGDRLSPLASSMLLVRTVWAMLVGAIMLGATLLLFRGEERTVLVLYTLILLPAALNTRWLHIGMERAGLVAAARVGGEVLRVAIVIALVHGPSDLRSVPLAQLAGEMLAALMLLAGLRRYGVRLSVGFDAALARGVMRRALPMAGSALLAVMIYNADLVFLRAFRDHAEVGLYLAGYTLLNFLGVLGHVVALTLVPGFTRLRTAPERATMLYRDAIARLFAIGLPMAAGGWATAPLLIVFVFGASYAESASVLGILIWVIPVLLLRSVMQAALIAHGRQDDVLRTTMAAAAANVGLNFVAVPLWGMYGAAVTTLLAETVRLFAATIYMRRTGLSGPAASRIVRAVAATAVMAGVLVTLKPASLWSALPMGAAVWAVTMLATGAVRWRGGRATLEV